MTARIIVRRADSFVSAHRGNLNGMRAESPDLRWIPRSGGSKFSFQRSASAFGSDQHGIAITLLHRAEFDLTKCACNEAATLHSIDLPAAAAGTILERLDQVNSVAIKTLIDLR